ncbi:MAG: DNA-3-methyladenine glycosylase [Deltaproteobacteria bacterium]|nr:DNA-3-methyladenine glycosylase [Deltaproteobacteria bacterium]
MVGSVRLSRAFFDRNAREVAPELIGAFLVRRRGREVLVAEIVETEAYVGAHDLACHARMGMTQRNAVMFGPAGFSYVYLIYGMHHCVNVVCGPGGDPNAVLFRAGKPVSEETLARLVERDGVSGRGVDPKRVSALLHSPIGPGNLAKALDLTRADTGLDLCSADGDVYFLPRLVKPKIALGPRIGVDYAGKWAKSKLRFALKGDPFVSRPRI